MILKDMFIKPIDRDIKGVIKVGQADEENIKQELEEYVVTRELQQHFANFFTNYKKGIVGDTDKMGVWISGFFGSGKSHFLKILSYLLQNKEVNGKQAIEYFEEDNKITDPMVLADMRLAASIAGNTDVILFNIDSKSEMTGKSSKDAIVSVFLKVFNEMQGFCGSMPYLADLERHLVEKSRYEEFQQKFQNKYEQTWLDSRHKFDFIQDTIVEILDEMNFMSEAAGRNWCEKATEQYDISIENFAKLINEYLKSKDKNHHVVFLVDEIGQYIGNDSKLMLNLQTVVEDLSIACHGKAWVIVTSQQDMDSITKDMATKANDFSKIQGRFDTRLSLSSANVDEVIKKRILEKNLTAEQTLKLLYEQKVTIIKNLLHFNDGIDKKLYTDGTSFASVYPFVPYQFNLLASVLTAIRKFGASGKNLSDGERSMIALFKESAMNLMHKEVGALIPFSAFYDALHQFLDHGHANVINRAKENDFINPDKYTDCFNVNVLKALFLIKYEKQITANVDNITSLMVDHIDADRIELKKKVEEALKVLVRQMLVQKNGEVYVFLTDEEQDINREVESQNVEMGEVIGSVSELIFDDIFSDKKYKYAAFNGRYSFNFNQIVDERPYKSNQNNDIGVRILTPNSYYGDDEMSLRLKSGTNKEVLVALPNDTAFLDELRAALKIEKYLRLNTGSPAHSKYEQIKQAKRSELTERKSNAKLFLTEALKNADIYVNGDKANIGSKEVGARINEALGSLVSNIYFKLQYIDTPMGEADIRNLFNNDKQISITVDVDSTANKNALNDMLDHITFNTNAHMKTSMKSLRDRFMKAPYGFVEDDVEWLVAKLFKNGDIAMNVSGSNISILSKSVDEIVRYIINKEYVEKLMVERRQKANDIQKRSVRDIMKEIFGITSMNDEDDAIMSSFQENCKEIKNELDKFEIMQKSVRFPGKNVVKEGKALILSAIQIQSPMEFFNKVHEDRDRFLDFAEDFEPVKAFFNGEQKNKFERALELMDIYDESKTFIVDAKIDATVYEIKEILNKDNPYSDIPKLPELLDRFERAYNNILEEMEGPVIAAIDDAKGRVLEVLDTKEYREEYIDKYKHRFHELYDKVKACKNVAAMQNIKNEADTLKVRILNEMEAIDKSRVVVPVGGITGGASGGAEGQAPYVIKKRKNISIKSVNVANSWQIESVNDIDKYLAELKASIIKELDEDTTVNIEF